MNASRSSCTVRSVVSTISSASPRIGTSRWRSSRMPSITGLSCASGCGRRVSLKRRTSAASPASRKISAGLSPRIARSFRSAFGNVERNAPSRTSTTIATRLRSLSARRDNSASVGIRLIGRLSTQKYPRSSSARIACDFPAPDRPVSTMNRLPVAAGRAVAAPPSRRRPHGSPSVRSSPSASASSDRASGSRSCRSSRAASFRAA